MYFNLPHIEPLSSQPANLLPNQPHDRNHNHHHNNTMKTHIKLLAFNGLLTLATLVASAQNTFPDVGNVGIGTLTPNKPLVVKSDEVSIIFEGHNAGSIQFHDGYGGELGYRVRSASGGGWRWQFIDGSNNEFFGVDYPTGDALIRGCLIIPNGKVGIGTTEPTHALTVNGPIRAKEIIVNTGWADDVFSKDYKLPSLAETERYIQSNGHLPGIPSAKEVRDNGVSVGESQSLLLRKIEELTLHMIQMEKRVAELEAENAVLKAK